MTRAPIATCVAVACAVLVALATTPAPAGATAPATYALSGSGSGLELSFQGQGVTLGAAVSSGDSTPQAHGAAFGQCEVLGSNPSPGDLPCTGSTGETSSYPGHPGDARSTCASPALPPQLAGVLDVRIACGRSSSAARAGAPVTTNSARVAQVTLDTDLSSLSPQLQAAKDQVASQLQQIFKQVPNDQLQNALDQLAGSLKDSQALAATLGPASSDIAPDGRSVTVSSTASGARIGVLGIPRLDPQGNVVAPGDAYRDGLLRIEIGPASARAGVRPGGGSAAARAAAAVVTVQVRDITKTTPSYRTISVAPGQSQTLFAGTPLESTITAARASRKVTATSAVAASDSVRLDLLKGVQGGIHLALGRATAAAGVRPAPQAPAPPEAAHHKELPYTGGPDLTLPGAALLAGALILLALRRLAAR